MHWTARPSQKGLKKGTSAGLAAAGLLLPFLGRLVDPLDDFRLGRDRAAAGVALEQHARRLVHGFLDAFQQLDHLLVGLLDDQLLHVRGEFVLSLGKLLRAGLMLGDLFGHVRLLVREDQGGEGEEKSDGLHGLVAGLPS